MTDYKDKILEDFDREFPGEVITMEKDGNHVRIENRLFTMDSLRSFLSDALTQAEERAKGKMGWEKIWCDDCEKVQPLLQDYMKKQLGNKYDAMDLVCGKCRIIIATLHKSKYLKKHE